MHKFFFTKQQKNTNKCKKDMFNYTFNGRTGGKPFVKKIIKKNKNKKKADLALVFISSRSKGI